MCISLASKSRGSKKFHSRPSHEAQTRWFYQVSYANSQMQVFSFLRRHYFTRKSFHNCFRHISAAFRSSPHPYSGRGWRQTARFRRSPGPRRRRGLRGLTLASSYLCLWAQKYDVYLPQEGARGRNTEGLVLGRDLPTWNLNKFVLKDRLSYCFLCGLRRW